MVSGSQCWSSIDATSPLAGLRRATIAESCAFFDPLGLRSSLKSAPGCGESTATHSATYPSACLLSSGKRALANGSSTSSNVPASPFPGKAKMPARFSPERAIASSCGGRGWPCPASSSANSAKRLNGDLLSASNRIPVAFGSQDRRRKASWSATIVALIPSKPFALRSPTIVSLLRRNTGAGTARRRMSSPTGHLNWLSQFAACCGSSDLRSTTSNENPFRSVWVKNTTSRTPSVIR